MRVWLAHHRPPLPLVLLAGLALVLLIGGGFALLEDDGVSTYWEGVWWALGLMTTIGFVGEAPQTTGGRVLSSVLMLAGFALVTFTTAAIASLFVREQEAPVEAMERAFERMVAGRLDEMAERLDRIDAAARRPAAGPCPSRIE